MAVDTPQLVQRNLRWLIRSTAVLYVVLIGSNLYFWHDSRDKADQISGISRSTQTAVCTFRTDLTARADASQQFLVDHPGGFLGVSAASIRNSLDGQRRTIAALATLDCS